jgi:hypothetical protein
VPSATSQIGSSSKASRGTGEILLKLAKSWTSIRWKILVIVSLFSVGSMITVEHLNRQGFFGAGASKLYLPFSAKLTVFLPEGGKLHILNAASPISARKTRLFVPIRRNFDNDAPLQATLDFNHQLFAETSRSWSTNSPRIYQSTFTLRRISRPTGVVSLSERGLAALGLGRDFTA